MRHLFIASAATAMLFAAGGAFSDCARAADVGPPPPAYWPPSAGPPPGYAPWNEYEPPPAYGPRSAYGLPPRYDQPDDYGPLPDYGPPPRPPRVIPYAASPVRPGCDLQWRCGPWGCGWHRVCYPQLYARPYRGYGPGYYGPY